MSQSRSLLVVGAHAADFVWRAAGVIAVVTAHGGKANVVALSYGERGESGELWKEPNQTIDRVKRIRHEEASRAADILGATFECFDLGDYPLHIDAQALERLTMLIRELAPDVIITHTERDPFNPDHPLASAAVQRASILASGSGVASGFPTIKPAELFLFEPHQPEHCGFVPTSLSISARFFHSSDKPWRRWPHKATFTSTRRISQRIAPIMRAVFPGGAIFSTRKPSNVLLPQVVDTL